MYRGSPSTQCLKFEIQQAMRIMVLGPEASDIGYLDPLGSLTHLFKLVVVVVVVVVVIVVVVSLLLWLSLSLWLWL